MQPRSVSAVCRRLRPTMLLIMLPVQIKLIRLALSEALYDIKAHFPGEILPTSGAAALYCPEAPRAWSGSVARLGCTPLGKLDSALAMQAPCQARQSCACKPAQATWLRAWPRSCSEVPRHCSTMPACCWTLTLAASSLPLCTDFRQVCHCSSTAHTRPHHRLSACTPEYKPVVALICSVSCRWLLR